MPTKEDIERTLDKFIRLGKYDFLREYGISARRSRTTFIRWRGHLCDMKAVVAVASGNPQTKHGHTHHVRRMVERMGFRVI